MNGRDYAPKNTVERWLKLNPGNLIYKRAEGATPDESDIAAIFEPITLTEDLLIKLGAKQLGSIYSLEIDELSRLSIYPTENAFELQAIDPETGNDLVDSFVSLKIDDKIHSLQNIFRDLSGKELTK